MKAAGGRGKVVIQIEKRLPVQGGMGAASSNAVATMLGLGARAGHEAPAEDKLRIAAEVGSDLPLFLIGGTVLGVGRGEEVYPLQDLPTHAPGRRDARRLAFRLRRPSRDGTSWSRGRPN